MYADKIRLSEATDEEVEAAFTAFEDAVAGGVRAVRLAARVQLYAVLQAHGWVPPHVVQQQMDRDLRELREVA
jgi:hypothetical protein